MTCMSLRNSLAAASGVLAVVSAAGLWFAAPAQAAAVSGPTCYGSVGCAGTMVNSTCTSDEVRVEQMTVGEVGQLVLYESPVCGTAWAQLVVDVSDPSEYASTGYEGGIGYYFAAEIFYEPATGGVEQFSASSPWTGGVSPAASTLTTPMLPINASFKACGGAPSDAMGAFEPFDDDPQGIGEVSEPQLFPGATSSTTPVPFASAGNPDYNADACTLWH
jgi:hypothetical protein